ncbi:hypothetical protein KUTeg_019350 [Tegillarca granosa]|uniref:Uncharacterized protein n=1 Tax=Tegillarca granosa TaxID=220873 RepID=A0ABQ9EED1_TEGGR|nr:hypothetical protein KUTeg_019350 [Tegillarca granosa]
MLTLVRPITPYIISVHLVTRITGMVQCEGLRKGSQYPFSADDTSVMMGVDLKFTDDGFAILTMNNGENRISTPYIRQLQKALDEVERNDNCKALLTTGEGKFFCNGIDLEWLKTANKEQFFQAIQDLYWRFMYFSLPTVAMINGHAFGAGANIALAHDYRVMRNDRGWFSLNEVRINVQVKPETIQLIRITGPEAKDLGIVDVTTDISSLEKSAKNLANLALGPTGIDRDMLQKMKQDIYPRITSNL